MPSELDVQTLEEEVGALSAQGWRVEHVPDTLRVYVAFSPESHEDVLCLRLDFGESLSSGPPSVTFCHAETHAEGRKRDWPRGLTEYFKQPPENGIGWICNPWTREGRAHHSEWNQHPWPATRHVWRVATAIRDILDKPGAYSGRLDE